MKYGKGETLSNSQPMIIDLRRDSVSNLNLSSSQISSASKDSLSIGCCNVNRVNVWSIVCLITAAAAAAIVLCFGFLFLGAIRKWFKTTRPDDEGYLLTTIDQVFFLFVSSKEKPAEHHERHPCSEFHLITVSQSTDNTWWTSVYQLHTHTCTCTHTHIVSFRCAYFKS